MNSPNTIRQQDRPAEFPLKIQGGMLEALGINMYATIGKCLVEFVANAHDAEATRVDISIPFDAIEEARGKARETAKAQVEAGDRDPFTILLTPLPEDLKITISDDGHGMSPEQIEERFLPVNRKRREDAHGEETVLTSESGKRHVMGRKGLGKLAGFGAATKVVIETKREGQDFATVFTLDDAVIREAEDIGEVRIPAEYIEGRPTEQKGTTVTLYGLKSDAVRYAFETIAKQIRSAFFGIRPEEMAIHINNTLIEQPDPDYVFVYPHGASEDDLADDEVQIGELATMPVRYMVGFRRQNLPTSQRGARIYCNKRLAAGPSLFGLPTGMHNFHSQSYMECIVQADELDRHGIDLINTNRSQLREDNEIVAALLEFVEERMRRALAAHAKWKEEVVDDEITKAPKARFAMHMTSTLEGPAKASARRLLRRLAIEHGADSREFEELAPLIVQTMNTGEVLIRLSHLETNVETIRQVALNLIELADIEKSDALKIYRGRRDAINALLALVRKGEHEFWKKKGIEKELHQLLKEEPWLIRPEFNRYLTSDERLTNVSTMLAEHLGVDTQAALDDPKRPDLVFLMSDTGQPHRIIVVELKSTSLPLKHEHLVQLKGYMAKIETYCRTELNRKVTVHGYLIGSMPDEKTVNDDERLLLSEIEKQGLNSEWSVMGTRSMLEYAQVANGHAIAAMEKDLADLDQDAERESDPENVAA